VSLDRALSDPGSMELSETKYLLGTLPAISFVENMVFTLESLNPSDSWGGDETDSKWQDDDNGL
jgi:hypothetical protein